MANKHALLIGIDSYPHYGEDQQLAGCVNDAMRMKQVLVEHFGFDPSNIRELHDEAASRQGILDAMDRLVDAAQPGDVVVFHYSGHGRRRLAKLRENTELRPTDGEWFDKSEGTRYDSTLMPSDTGPRPHPHLDITDNTINSWLQRLTAITENVTLVFDACHSGTVTRGSTGVKVRTVPPDDRGPEELHDAADGASQSPPMLAKKGKSGWLPLSGSYTVISGSRDSETSKEMDVSGGSPFKRHGALTYNLTNALTGAIPGSTHRDVFEIAGREVTRRFKTQHPQIEGALDREIFGTQIIPPMRFIPVEAVGDGTVMLRGGAIHGLQANTQWDVYPAGTKQTQGTRSLTRLEVRDVGPLTAQAEIVGAEGEITPGCRCVDVARVHNADRETLARRYESSLALGNPHSKHDVRFELLRVLPNGELEPLDAFGFELAERDRIAFRIINNDETAVFVSILSFGVGGEVTHLYPRRKSSELIAGSREVLVGAQRAKLRVNLDGFDGDVGLQHYKAFFSTRPIDLMWLCQDAPGEAEQQAATRPRQLSASRGKSATRSSKKADEQLADREDWTAITQSVSIRRRGR